ncbi:hypothetical protein D3C81_1900120 [compost metagenome]
MQCILASRKEEEAMDIDAKARDPREHINEEPRNDLGDLLTGFFGMTGFMTLVFFGMVIVKFIMSE